MTPGARRGVPWRDVPWLVAGFVACALLCIGMATVVMWCWPNPRLTRAARPGAAETVYVVKPETVYAQTCYMGLREYSLQHRGVKRIHVFEFTEQPAPAGRGGKK